MNKLFQEMIMESTIEFEKLRRNLFIESSEYHELMVEEAASSVDDEGFFTRIIEKIREIVKSVKDKLAALFKHEKIDNAVKTLEDAKKTNPQIMTTTITMVDYQKLQKLNDDTSKELTKEGVDVEEKMKKYRSQRNKILAASAVVTVTLGSALYMITKSKNEKIQELDTRQRETESKLNILKGRYIAIRKELANEKESNLKLSNENERLRERTLSGKTKVVAKQASERMKNASEKNAKDIANIKAAVSAQTEVLQNATTDTLHQVQDAVKTVINPDSSVLTKIKSVKDTVAQPAKSVKSVIDGSEKQKVLEKRLSEVKEKRDKYKRKIENAQKILKSDSASDEQKERAKEFLTKVPAYMERLKKEYGIIKSQMK